MHKLQKSSPLRELSSVREYLERVGAELRSLMSAVVAEEADGYMRDRAKIRFSRDGQVSAPKDLLPTPEEAARIAGDVRSAKFPEQVTPKRRPSLPDELKKIDDKFLAWFTDTSGRFLFLQQRIDKPDGRKDYIPYTLWTDGWRIAEPESGLPLWGQDQLNNSSIVFIHEGVKAARHCRWMTQDSSREAKAALKAHPFGDFLSFGAHLAWVGGAHSPHRTNWSVLAEAGVQFAFIVTDNDEVGRAALPAIAEAIRIRAAHLQFTSEWPTGFDLADEFPKTLFRTVGNVTRYVGPELRALLHPATWATDMVQPAGKKRSVPVLREVFKGSWVYVEEPQLFVSTDVRGLVLDQDALNNRYRSLSHTPRIGDYILRDFRGRVVGAAYRPDVDPGLITQRDRSAYNLYQPSLIFPAEGDPEPWLEFVRYLFPKEEEQREVLRWTATLLARPEVRMKYGLLLVSEQQGTGKTTYAEEILVKIVGEHNCSFPSERDIVDSAFNPWLARKRLVVVREIYAGHSFKAYNTLKAAMTDPTIYVNEKNRPQYQMENWAHFVASSNSKKALRMEDSDRRWFYPTVTEERWKKQQFADFYDWLRGGGLPIIAWWAAEFGDYVGTGDDAPRSQEKDDLIAESRTAAERLAILLGDRLNQVVEPACVSMHDVLDWARTEVRDRVFDTIDVLRRAMRTVDVYFAPDRIKLNGQLHSVAMNSACRSTIASMCPLDRNGNPECLTPEARDFLRSKLVTPQTIFMSSL